MVKLEGILELINTIAPFDIAEKWDNCGLQVGSLNWEVKKIMIGLDVSLPLMNAAKENYCDLVLTHHPLMLKAEKNIDFSQMPGKAIEIAARHRINIISAHTNLDKAIDGLNDYFADKIGIEQTKVFFIDNESDVSSYDAKGNDITGIGRIGFLKKEIALGQFAKIIKEKLALSHLRVIGNMDKCVNMVAVCTGSGGSLVNAFLESKADVYITGDIKYHEARLVEQNSKSLIDVGHFGSEHIAVEYKDRKI